MKCDFCAGTTRVKRLRLSHFEDVDSYLTVVDTVTCPRCIRGVRVLGTHEMLRDSRGIVHRPGEVIYTDYIDSVRVETKSP